jgi:5-hydroxyisourate hydrolase
MASLSTHVLDIARGVPAAGVDVALWHLGGHPRELGRGMTDTGGRVTAFSATLARGIYELRFFVHGYFEAQQTPSFYDEIPVRFTIADDAAHYHVPLLLSPSGYTTYRGS